VCHGFPSPKYEEALLLLARTLEVSFCQKKKKKTLEVSYRVAGAKKPPYSLV
jgi:hypothetical protein